MKRYIFILTMALLCMPEVFAQFSYRTEGTCGEDIKWSHDGFTLVMKVEIQKGIKNIGSCAFANCQTLQEVVFEGNDLENIGWGAFLNCGHLRNISLPVMLRNIETIAFANCISLPSTSIPDQCRVGDQAYASCTNLKSITHHVQT